MKTSPPDAVDISLAGLVVDSLRSTTRFFGLLVLLQAICVAGIGISVSVEAIESGDVVLSGSCPILDSTGVPCPTCGMTRGLCAFFHGEIERSFSFHPLAPLIGLVELLIVFYGVRLIWVRRWWSRPV